jgi:hypothetical protein
MDYTFYDPDLFKHTKGSAYSHVPCFDNELEFHAWLHKVFEFHGWTTLSEQSPHGSDFKADMIVEDPETKNWVGLELKFCDTKNAIHSPAAALGQIVGKYSNKKYCFGEQIDLWCYVPYVARKLSKGSVDISWVRELFCYYGIGILNLSRDFIILDFALSKKDKKKMVGSWPRSLRTKESDAERRDRYPTDWEKIRDDSLHKIKRIKP